MAFLGRISGVTASANMVEGAFDAWQQLKLRAEEGEREEHAMPARETRLVLPRLAYADHKRGENTIVEEANHNDS